MFLLLLFGGENYIAIFAYAIVSELKPLRTIDTKIRSINDNKIG